MPALVIGGLLFFAVFLLYANGKFGRQDIEGEIAKLDDPVQIGTYKRLLDDPVLLTELRKIA